MKVRGKKTVEVVTVLTGLMAAYRQVDAHAHAHARTQTVEGDERDRGWL